MENQPFPTLSVISDRSELSGIGMTWLDDRPVPCLSPAIAAVDAEVIEMEGGA
jgi:hypothetical protein